MKKWSLFLGLYAGLCLLAGCAAGEGAPLTPVAPAPAPQPSQEPEPPAVTEVFRLVSEDDGTLLLAKRDGGSGDVYTLTAGGDGDFEVGTLLEVGHSGLILETFPAQFADVSAVTALPDGFDDLCGLYLDVLDDLWDVDGGLNSDLAELGVDLSQTRLSPGEQAAVAWAFGQEHGLAPVQGTWQELADQGYITGEPLGADAPEGAKFWQWERGCLFSIREDDAPDPDGSDVAFTAEKWCSSLGAYFFADCTAERSARGAWGEYTVGSHMIS